MNDEKQTSGRGVIRRPDGMIGRLQVSKLRPETIDEATRSVEVTAATEAPARVWDPERLEVVTEILRMSGCQIPDGASVPLTIEHDHSAGAVIGSLREMRIDGDRLTGRAVFSTASDAEPYWTKVREGHLKRFSIAYPAGGGNRDSVYIAEGQTAVVEGRTHAGPLVVTTRWQPRALGLVLFAADDQATARAARHNEQSTKEIDTMDTKLRQFLIRCGLPEAATDDEAGAFMDTLDVQRAAAKAEPSPDAAEMTRAAEKAARAERERITEITALCSRFDLGEIATKAIAEGRSVAQTQTDVLDAVAKRNDDPGFRSAQVIADERDKFRAAAVDAMLIRSGRAPEKPAAGSRDLAGWSLSEIARHSLGMVNQSTGGSRLEMVGRAMLSSDFPLLLANIAEKSLFEGWEGAQETWQTWCATGSVNDFKTNYLPRISESDDLDQVAEGEEYKYGKRTEGQESFAIATYGKLMAITRQTIINDDLGALTDTPRAHGEAAARKVADLPYAVLTGNAAMGDGVALFHASTHKNLVAHGSGAPPAVNTLAAGILAMGTQKDLQNLRRLNINPQFLLAPKALQGVAEVFFRSEYYADPVTAATDSHMASTRANPYSGNYLTRVYDARLDDSDAKQWYLAAAKGRTVKVFFLGGNQTPYMETRQGFTVDGVEYKVRIDAGAKAVDWRGLYCNNGD